ncbi:hypothetical protein H2200_010979 [Cladophialophora chaetospira]|uniref:Uncharacterized protein n=1 Tax=Cladophialophora chaetospira TaxID=386627 RepID=A0AA39CE39_9EURO|nr:hypothetical protein H2200_010979 [Cladophialophora chaetospira]
MPGTVLCDDDLLKVSSQIMRDSLDPAKEKMATVAIGMLDKMAEKMINDGEAGKPPIDELLVCGGASSNEHTQTGLENRVQQWTASRYPGAVIPVNFVMNDGRSPGLMKTASGGTLVLANGPMMNNRVLRRECFLPNGGKNRAFGQLMLKKVFLRRQDEKHLVQFLTHDKQIPGEKRFHHFGHVGLVMNQCRTLTSGDEGWQEEIRVYFDQNPLEINKKIKNEGATFTDDEFAQFEHVTIKIFIPKDYVMALPAITQPIQDTKYIWRQGDYKLSMWFEGTDVHFLVKFNDSNTGVPGPSFERKMNWEAAFYPVGAAFPRE